MTDANRFAPAVPWVLFLTTMVFFVMFPRLLISPLLIRIAGDLSITYDRASSFFVTGSVGFVGGLLTSGFVSKRLTHRGTIVLSTAVAGLALVALAFVRSELGFHLVFLVETWANGLYPGSGITSVTTLVPDAHRGKALAVHESGPNLAFIIAPILSAFLAPHIGWRGVIGVTGGAAILTATAFLVAGRGSGERGEPPHFENLKLFVHNRPFWALSVFFMLAGTCAMGVFNVLPTYLMVEHHYSEQLVNTLVGVSRISAFAAIFAAGGLADRFGIRVVIGVIIGVTGALTLGLGFASGTTLLVVVFLQPIVVGSFFPVGLSALANTTPPGARNLAVALAIPLANIVGAGVAPWLFAALGSAGYFSASFVGLGIVSIAGLGLLPLIAPQAPPPPSRQAVAE